MARSANFSYDELEVLISCIEETPELVFGELGGRFKTTQDQKRRWEFITEQVNLVCPAQQKRTRHQINTKWTGVKYQVRAKVAQIKNDKENGVRPSKKLTDLEERVVKLLFENSFNSAKLLEHQFSISEIQASHPENEYCHTVSTLCENYKDIESKYTDVNLKSTTTPVIISFNEKTEHMDHVHDEAEKDTYSNNDQHVTESDNVILEEPATINADILKNTEKLNGSLDDYEIKKSSWPSLIGTEKIKSATIRSQRHRLKRQRIREAEEKEVERKVIETQESMAKDLKEINSTLKNIEKAIERNNRNQDTMITLLAKYLNVEITEADE